MKRASHLPIFLSSLLIALALSAVEGCGGGGSGSASITGQDQLFGPFQTRATSGKPQVVSQSVGAASITGVAGASFSKITYAPNPTPSNSRLLYVTAFGGPSAIYIANNDGTNPHAVPNAFPSLSATWSRDGRIAFDGYDPSIGHNQIYVINSDGTNLHKISTGNLEDTYPVWAPDNFHIAFTRVDATGHSQIYTMTSSGGSVFRVTDGTGDCYFSTWTTDSTALLFDQFDSGLGRYDLDRVNANGTGFAIINSTFNSRQLAMAPTGTRVAQTFVNGSDYALQLIRYPSGTLGGPVKTTSGTSYYAQGWSPDGTKLLYLKLGPGYSELDFTRADAEGETVLATNNDPSVQGGQWEPYPSAIPYVASSGGYTVYNASSGFLFGMNGAAFSSFVNFTATTPASTSITVDPITTGATNVLYHIHADALTSLRYVNGFGGGVTIVSLGAAAQHAIVSFNAADGSIAGVFTLAAKTGNALKTLQHLNTSTLQGSFTAVYNAKGINLAHHGASEVTLNKSGEVVSVK